MPYDQNFFANIRATSQQSATVVVGHLLSGLRPTSVVDIGCARGDWLKAFMDQGILDVLGLDGNYVDRSDLSIPQDCFRAADLAKPLLIDRRFDLAICLEVAEHIPESEAKRFVRDLTRIADLTLFSAAIPGQGGTG